MSNASKQILEFTVGPRKVTVVYDHDRRAPWARRRRWLVVRAIVCDGVRVDRATRPELWRELHADFLTLKN